MSMAGRDKASFVRAMFDRIAQRYDLMNTLMTFGRHQAWRRAAARLAQPAPNSRALDLGTGTGDFVRALLDVEPTARVVGIDFALAMLELGREKLDGRGRLVGGDISHLPFEANTFNCAVNAFVLRNVADVGDVLAEMYRVLEPGGRAVSLEITLPRLPIFRQLFSFYFGRFVPFFGGLVTGQSEAYHYLPASVRLFPAPEVIAGLLRDRGFREVSYRRWAIGTVVGYYGVK